MGRTGRLELGILGILGILWKADAVFIVFIAFPFFVHGEIFAFFS